MTKSDSRIPMWNWHKNLSNTVGGSVRVQSGESKEEKKTGSSNQQVDWNVT